MRGIRTFTLAVAFALAAFCLSLATPAISAADKAVNIQGRATATGKFDTTTARVDELGTGTLSHMGRFTYHLRGGGTVNPDGTFSGSGDITIQGSNGDQITGTYTVTGVVPNGTAIITITGGTGRLADASGTLTLRAEGPPARQEGQFFVFDVTERWSGQIVKGSKPTQATTRSGVESSQASGATLPSAPSIPAAPDTSEAPATTPIESSGTPPASDKHANGGTAEPTKARNYGAPGRQGDKN